MKVKIEIYTTIDTFAPDIGTDLFELTTGETLTLTFQIVEQLC